MKGGGNMSNYFCEGESRVEVQTKLNNVLDNLSKGDFHGFTYEYNPNTENSEPKYKVTILTKLD